MTFDLELFKKEIVIERQVNNRLGMRECALVIGISSATLSRIERGNMPDTLTFAKVCKWLKKPMEHFIIN